MDIQALTCYGFSIQGYRFIAKKKGEKTIGLTHKHQLKTLTSLQKRGTTNEMHSIAPTSQAPIRNRQTRKVANAKVRNRQMTGMSIIIKVRLR